MPVAHWYSSGWNKWCWARSTRVTATGARRSARAANSPAKPPPTITTRRGPAWSGMTCTSSSGSHAAAAIPHGSCSPRGPQVHELPDRLARELLGERAGADVLPLALAAEAEVGAVEAGQRRREPLD